MAAENAGRLDQSIPQDILQARDNAATRPMSKGTVQTGNRMMVEKILSMPVQPYQEGISAYRVLETVGRKSGQMRQIPLAVFQFEGERYLIAPSRERDWVYNLMAFSTATLVTQEHREQVHATVTLDDASIRATQAYMASLPDWTLRQFPFSSAASAEEIRTKQKAFAIFRLS